MQTGEPHPLPLISEEQSDRDNHPSWSEMNLTHEEIYVDYKFDYCDFGWYCGAHAFTWSPILVEKQADFPGRCYGNNGHLMSGVDLAIFHGNVRTFEMLVSLRGLHRRFNPDQPSWTDAPHLVHHWLWDDDRVAEARESCEW